VRVLLVHSRARQDIFQDQLFLTFVLLWNWCYLALFRISSVNGGVMAGLQGRLHKEINGRDVISTLTHTY
jgi:hypothetical protein